MIILIIIMGILAIIVYNFLMGNMSSTISLVIAVLISVVIYYICLKILNVKELKNVINSFKRKLLKNKKLIASFSVIIQKYY